MAKIVRSEYEYSDYEKYLIARQNTSFLILDHSDCRVIFNEKNNTVELYIDDFFATEFEKENDRESNTNTAEEYLKRDESSRNKDIPDEEAPETDEGFKRICKKFNVSFHDKVNDWEEIPKYYDHEFYQNSLSGSTVTYPLGEGLLDFIYFDVHKNLDSLKLFMAFFSDEFRDAYAQETGTELSSFNSSVKTKNHDETAEYLSLNWKNTHDFCAAYFYNSLYTAAFPPIFLNESEKSVNRYFNYLIILQKEFKEKLKFCFDPEFYPTVLGHLYPSERYALYCYLYKDQPLSLNRNEEFTMRYGGSGGEMPFGCSSDFILERLNNTPIDEDSEEFKEFNEKYCHGRLIDLLLKLPRSICVEYTCSSIFEMLNLEFTKMLEANLKIRKCKRCGRYFIMKGNYDTNYCDRVAEGETRTCQELAAQENYKAKVADNPALPIYSRYYKRYAARVRVHQIKEEAFKKWKYKAMSKRDECTEGKITPEEFTEWMESSFPNRKPKA